MHFSVLIVRERPEKQLAPYVNFGEVRDPEEVPEEYRPFLVFIDTARDDRKGYDTGTLRMVVLPDGRKYPVPGVVMSLEGRLYDDRCLEVYEYAKGLAISRGERPDKDGSWIILTDQYIKEGIIRTAEVPIKEIWPTFADYMENQGYSKRDEKAGAYGFYYYPKGEYDWCVLGGRWAGFFKLKGGAYGLTVDELQKLRQFHEQDQLAYLRNVKDGISWADQCLVKGIDIEGTRQRARKRANAGYDHYEASGGRYLVGFRHRSVPDLQPMVRLYRDINPVPIGNKLDPDDVTRFRCGRDEYIARAERDALTTAVVLKDGEWKTRPGAFRPYDPEWTEEFLGIFNSLPPDTLVSVYDCHV